MDFIVEQQHNFPMEKDRKNNTHTVTSIRHPPQSNTKFLNNSNANAKFKTEFCASC